MKKTYVTPKVYFENFKLSANIASCADFEVGATNHSDIQSCGIMPDGTPGFIFANSACQYTPQDFDISFFCYHTMNADLMFTS